MITLSNQPNVAIEEARLSELAMRYRGTKDSGERKDIAREYAATVRNLIDSRNWVEMPAQEDQLPDVDMPKEFFAYWS